SGGMATEMAVGLAIAQQIMQQQGGSLLGGAPAAAAGSALPEMLGPEQVAKALGVSVADVMAVIDSGELKAKRIGDSVRVKRTDLDSYLAS
ncbi:MAG: helix-turn-helix domain-containing protein, partial [Acidobacteriota bacterium]|nr:helix-turn-helix domain-containing protein [Acidobacteriota bacterium]